MLSPDELDTLRSLLARHICQATVNRGHALTWDDPRTIPHVRKLYRDEAQAVLDFITAYPNMPAMLQGDPDADLVHILGGDR